MMGTNLQRVLKSVLERITPNTRTDIQSNFNFVN